MGRMQRIICFLCFFSVFYSLLSISDIEVYSKKYNLSEKLINKNNYLKCDCEKIIKNRSYFSKRPIFGIHCVSHNVHAILIHLQVLSLLKINFTLHSLLVKFQNTIPIIFIFSIFSIWI